MFMEERHQRIMEMLKEKSRVEVQDLSQVFDVSEDTIRRDLRIMEKSGKVQRTYGGAIIPENAAASKEFSVREAIKADVKNEIARFAASFIKDGDTILLDGSTTVAKIVPYLCNFKEITVITNSIGIAHEIINTSADVKLFITGGLVRNDIANVVSHTAIEEIRKLYVDKVFIGTCSISYKGELTTPVVEEADIKKAILEAGREVFIMADSSKFGQRTGAWCGKIKPEYTIITDKGVSEDILKELNFLIKKGLKVIKE